ncbi:MAG: kinase [Ruminococcaceae bacterium]|nr:kinase [Oscillospiraceae bacterium]
MITVKAPFRISFFGGGTDFYDYYSRYGGEVLSTTIDKYCYVTLRDLPPFYEFKNQFTYSKIERFNSPEEVSHPLLRNVFQMLPYEHLQIVYDADLPACSGLGTSSAFAVALLQGIHAMRGEFPDKETLAREAVHLERELCAEAGGVQDQYATAYGGLNRFCFTKDKVSRTALSISVPHKKMLEENLLLFFTGFARFSGEIAKQNQENISHNLATLETMKQMVRQGEVYLEKGELDDFGRLLDESWQMKKTLAQGISGSQIDEIYSKAMANGALGGKLLGAGGGGFLLLYVPKHRQPQVKKALADLEFSPFHFENSGSSIIINND